MSPIIPPFFTSTMTPTFSYDSYGFYHHHQHHDHLTPDGFSQQQMQQMQQHHQQTTTSCFHAGASTSTCEVHADFFKGVTHAMCWPRPYGPYSTAWSNIVKTYDLSKCSIVEPTLKSIIQCVFMILVHFYLPSDNREVNRINYLRRIAYSGEGEKT